MRGCKFFLFFRRQVLANVVEIADWDKPRSYAERMRDLWFDNYSVLEDVFY